jgi:hypothetical protein
MSGGALLLDDTAIISDNLMTTVCTHCWRAVPSRCALLRRVGDTGAYFGPVRSSPP